MHAVDPAAAPDRDRPPPADRRARRPGGRRRRPGGRQEPVTDLHQDQARRPEARPPAGRGAHPGRRPAQQPGPERPRAQSRAVQLRRGARHGRDRHRRPRHPRRRHRPGHPRRLADRAQGLPAPVGRTARAGAAGVVITLQAPAQADQTCARCCGRQASSRCAATVAPRLRAAALAAVRARRPGTASVAACGAGRGRNCLGVDRPRRRGSSPPGRGRRR